MALEAVVFDLGRGNGKRDLKRLESRDSSLRSCQLGENIREEGTLARPWKSRRAHCSGEKYKKESGRGSGREGTPRRESYLPLGGKIYSLPI